jgi:hypothetical protein
MVPVHQSPSVLLLREAFDKGDQHTIGLKTTHSFAPHGLSVTDVVLPQRVRIKILDILTHLWYHHLYIGNGII